MNNFLAEKTKMLEAELFQVRTQLGRTSNAKLDEMLNLWKFAFDRIDLGMISLLLILLLLVLLCLSHLLIMLILKTMMLKLF